MLTGKRARNLPSGHFGQVARVDAVLRWAGPRVGKGACADKSSRVAEPGRVDKVAGRGVRNSMGSSTWVEAFTQFGAACGPLRGAAAYDRVAGGGFVFRFAGGGAGGAANYFAGTDAV